MNVLVVGAGAIGTFYGAKLWQAGARVSLLCRSDYDVVSRRGIKIESVWGDFDGALPVVRDCAEFAEAGDCADVILVALKVLPEIDIVSMIRPAVVPGHTRIVLMQNGVEIEAPIAKAFPDNNVISALAFTCINRVGPGHIRHLDYGRITLGDYPNGLFEFTRALGERFESVDVPIVLTDDIVRARWLKLVWNAPFNPMSVLGGGRDTAQILACAESADIVRKVMEEVVAIAAATGHPLPESAVDKNIADTARMAPYRTSMCLDLAAGRPLEVEAILGNAVRAARREGVPAPHMTTLYALLRHVDATIRERFGAC